MQALNAILDWLDRTAFAAALRAGVWFYPTLETLHILGLAIFFGSIVLLDVRLLGVSRALPLRLLAPHALAATYGAFALLVVSGAGMFIADARELASNVPFQGKVVLIALGLLNAFVFNLSSSRRVSRTRVPNGFPWRRGSRAAVSLCVVDRRSGAGAADCVCLTRRLGGLMSRVDAGRHRPRRSCREA